MQMSGINTPMLSLRCPPSLWENPQEAQQLSRKVLVCIFQVVCVSISVHIADSSSANILVEESKLQKFTNIILQRRRYSTSELVPSLLPCTLQHTICASPKLEWLGVWIGSGSTTIIQILTLSNFAIKLHMHCTIHPFVGIWQYQG